MAGVDGLDQQLIDAGRTGELGGGAAGQPQAAGDLADSAALGAQRPTSVVVGAADSTRGLTEAGQGRSIVSGPMIMGGAFRSFAAARSRRSWLATWPVTSV
jgi:hypothetical protein